MATAKCETSTNTTRLLMGFKLKEVLTNHPAIFIYIYIYVCIYMYLYIYIHIHVYMYIYVHRYIYVYISMYVYVFRLVYIYINICPIFIIYYCDTRFTTSFEV